jgi:hypothetical protein
LEDFIKFLEKRITDYIFFEIKEVSQENDLNSQKNTEITMHFLGSLPESYGLVLYETKLKFSSKDIGNSEDLIIKEMQKVLDITNLNIKLIKGKIREIYISYS